MVAVRQKAFRLCKTLLFDADFRHRDLHHCLDEYPTRIREQACRLAHQDLRADGIVDGQKVHGAQPSGMGYDDRRRAGEARFEVREVRGQLVAMAVNVPHLEARNLNGELEGNQSLFPGNGFRRVEEGMRSSESASQEVLIGIHPEDVDARGGAEFDSRQ